MNELPGRIQKYPYQGVSLSDIFIILLYTLHMYITISTSH